jgi:hypothetical protein
MDGNIVACVLTSSKLDLVQYSYDGALAFAATDPSPEGSAEQDAPFE